MMLQIRSVMIDYIKSRKQDPDAMLLALKASMKSLGLKDYLLQERRSQLILWLFGMMKI